MKKVILSFPYSGAIQAFFAHQLVGMDTHREPDSYYGTLWGKPDSQLQAFSLTLFTLYERWAEPDEMAQCALHLLTMPYLMGQVVMADGGYR